MPDYKITIEIKDVADGDVIDLCDELLSNHGRDFDAARGDFTVTAAKLIGDNYYPFDWQDED